MKKKEVGAKQLKSVGSLKTTPRCGRVKRFEGKFPVIFEKVTIPGFHAPGLTKFKSTRGGKG